MSRENETYGNYTYGNTAAQPAPRESYSASSYDNETGGNYQSSSSGTDMISSLVSSGVDTGAIISEYLYASLEKDRLTRWREEDLNREADRYEDTLKQVEFNNQMNQKGFALSEDQFNFGKMRWKNEFNFTKSQAEEQKMWKEKEWKSMGLDKLALGVQNTINNDGNLKNAILQRAGF